MIFFSYRSLLGDRPEASHLLLLDLGDVEELIGGRPAVAVEPHHLADDLVKLGAEIRCQGLVVDS